MTLNFVNSKQTKQERKAKYDYCRSLGLSSHMSKYLRDWRKSAIDARLQSLLYADKQRQANKSKLVDIRDWHGRVLCYIPFDFYIKVVVLIRYNSECSLNLEF